MKSSKSIFTLVLVLVMCVTLVAQTAERTLIKSFNLKGNTSLVLDLNGEVDVQHWKNDLVRIQININIDNASESILKSLIAAGRYNLKGSETENGFLIDAPALVKEVKLRGQLLAENLSYTVFAPETVAVELANESSTTYENTEDNSSSL